MDDLSRGRATLTRSCTTSGYSQTSNNAPVGMHTRIPSRVSHSALVKSATGIGSSHQANSSRSKLAKRLRNDIDTFGDRNRAIADFIPAACQSSLVSFGQETPTGGSLRTPAPATAPQCEEVPCACMQLDPAQCYAPDRAFQEPPMKHPRGESELMSQPSGAAPMCEDSAVTAPPAPVGACRTNFALDAMTKAATAPPKKDLGLSSIGQMNGRKGDACKRLELDIDIKVDPPVAGTSESPQTCERPSMFEIWDFIRQGAGEPISSVSAASVAAFTCDGPFSRPPRSAARTGAGC